MFIIFGFKRSLRRLATILAVRRMSGVGRAGPVQRAHVPASLLRPGRAAAHHLPDHVRDLRHLGERDGGTGRPAHGLRTARGSATDGGGPVGRELGGRLRPAGAARDVARSYTSTSAWPARSRHRPPPHSRATAPPCRRRRRWAGRIPAQIGTALPGHPDFNCTPNFLGGVGPGFAGPLAVIYSRKDRGRPRPRFPYQRSLCPPVSYV